MGATATVTTFGPVGELNAMTIPAKAANGAQGANNTGQILMVTSTRGLNAMEIGHIPAGV